LHLAHSTQDPIHLVWAYCGLGVVWWALGECVLARKYLAQSLAHYDPQKHRTYGFAYDPGVNGLYMLAIVLEQLGYPAQALQKGQEALALGRELTHPLSLVLALGAAAQIYRRRGEQQTVQALEEERSAIALEQGFTQDLALGNVRQGWDLVEKGQH